MHRARMHSSPPADESVSPEEAPTLGTRHGRALPASRPRLELLITAGCLARGDVGMAVDELQRRLGLAGLVLERDGVFGPKTEMALLAFQSSRHLAPSGRLDEQTLAELVEVAGEDLRAQQAAPKPTAADIQGATNHLRLGGSIIRR